MPDEELCGICQNRSIQTTMERTMKACRECATEVGIMPMPPARRPARPCAHCNSFQFMRVIPREHSVYPAGERNVQRSAPMYLTHSPTATSGFFRMKADPIAIQDGFGLLEAYVCRKCGVVEWYCADVETIPAHPHLMSELIDYEATAEGPYR